jgi:hypothetical protein
LAYSILQGTFVQIQFRKTRFGLFSCSHMIFVL